ncbi:MAG: topoisomerase DNA-binding C4 zinc finger domain-containing protein [Candidatus Micrarchaeota archaeon]
MNCAVCGKTATKYNAKGVPVCSAHALQKTKEPLCPKCKIPMKLAESKYGKFWGCTAFPMCDGMQKI